MYKGKHDAQFELPTVEGVDFPNLGICEARNEVTDGTLHVSTYAATAARRGEATRWQVAQLPDPKAVQVYCDDEQYSDWGIIDAHTIEINSSIAAHNFRIVWCCRRKYGKRGAKRKSSKRGWRGIQRQCRNCSGNRHTLSASRTSELKLLLSGGTARVLSFDGTSRRGDPMRPREMLCSYVLLDGTSQAACPAACSGVPKTSPVSAAFCVPVSNCRPSPSARRVK